MKKSTSVAAPLLASAALAMLAGCKQPQMKRCVDEHNTVVDDSFCDRQPGQQQTDPNSNTYPYYYYHPGLYRWYYGGAGTYYPGSFATGGGFSPATGASYATSRGGFGGTSSEGGGHGGAGE